jgi:hypothetical protein
MRNPLLAALMALLFGCTQSNYEQSLTAIRLDMDDGSICSGTIVGPHVLLTAAHCLEREPIINLDKIQDDQQGPPAPPKKPEPKKPKKPFNFLDLITIPPPFTSVAINGRETKILSIVPDHNDHVLVEVDYTFNHYASLAVNRPAVGGKVHYWGNPAGKLMVYREGYVSFYDKTMMEMDVNGFFGDSGSGIFNEAGQIVGVMNVIDFDHHHGLQFSLMGSEQLEFTPQQLDMLGIQ